MGPLKSGCAARVKRERERAARPPPNASGCFIFPRGPAAAQRQSGAPLSRAAPRARVKERDGERKGEKRGGGGGREISKTDDSPAPHDLPPSACHSQSLSQPLCFSLSFSPLFTRTRSWLTGGADILGGVIPGVESLRSPCCDPVIPGRGRVLEACRERKRLYIKTTFRPRGCITAPLHGYK